MLYWFFNIFIGLLLLIGGSLTGYSYLKQKVNGLNLAISLLGIEIGLAFIVTSLLALGFTRLYWPGVAGQLHFILTIAYFIWKLFNGSPNTETTGPPEKYQTGSATDRSGDHVQHRSSEDASRKS